jgi:hypothetical protein
MVNIGGEIRLKIMTAEMKLANKNNLKPKSLNLEPR